MLASLVSYFIVLYFYSEISKPIPHNCKVFLEYSYQFKMTHSLKKNDRVTKESVKFFCVIQLNGSFAWKHLVCGQKYPNHLKVGLKIGTEAEAFGLYQAVSQNRLGPFLKFRPPPTPPLYFVKTAHLALEQTVNRDFDPHCLGNWRGSFCLGRGSFMAAVPDSSQGWRVQFEISSRHPKWLV